MRNYLKGGTIIITLTLFGCWLFSVEKHHMQLPIDSYVLVTGSKIIYKYQMGPRNKKIEEDIL